MKLDLICMRLEGEKCLKGSTCEASFALLRRGLKMRLCDFDAKAKTNLVFHGVLECVVGEAGGGLNVGRHDGDEILEVHQVCNEKRGEKGMHW